MVKPMQNVIKQLLWILKYKDNEDVYDPLFTRTYTVDELYMFIKEHGDDPYVSIGFVNLALEHLVCKGEVVKIECKPPLYHIFIDNE